MSIRYVQKPWSISFSLYLTQTVTEILFFLTRGRSLQLSTESNSWMFWKSKFQSCCLPKFVWKLFLFLYFEVSESFECAHFCQDIGFKFLNVPERQNSIRMLVQIPLKMVLIFLSEWIVLMRKSLPGYLPVMNLWIYSFDLPVLQQVPEKCSYTTRAQQLRS